MGEGERGKSLEILQAFLVSWMIFLSVRITFLLDASFFHFNETKLYETQEEYLILRDRH